MSETTSAHLTTDVVMLASSGGQRYVLLIQRGWDPFAGCWALPGGYVDTGERFERAALRELGEETGLTVRNLVQIGVYDEPDRDPRGRVVSVAFTACLPFLPWPTAGDDAREARWLPLDEARAMRLAFDHTAILRDALHVWGL